MGMGQASHMSRECRGSLLLWRIVLLSCCWCLCRTQGPEIASSQQDALNATLNAWEPSSHDLNWNFSLPCENNTGLSCNDQGMVIAIELPSMGLVGSIASELGDLTSLTNLNLANNSINGSVPVTLTNLKDLQFLNLSDNALAAAPGGAFMGLHRLSSLNMSKNEIYGRIRGMRFLPNLTSLDLSDNQFNGPIPATLGILAHITYLNLAKNNLGGSIPPLHVSLKCINVAKNDLSGSFPNSVLSLSKLTSLNLDSNIFDGSIPGNISQLGALKELILSNNGFSASLPNTFSALNQLTTLDVSGNTFSAILPDFNVLSTLNFGNNQLYNIPTILPVSLTSLDLSGNLLGLGPNVTLPPSLVSLVSLNVADNQFGGDPTELDTVSVLSSLLSLKSLDLSTNDWNTSIPASFSVFSGLTQLRISNGSLKLEVPAFFDNFTNLQVLDLSYNKLNGTVPPAFAEFQQLKSLSIANVLMFCPKTNDKCPASSDVVLSNAFCQSVCPNFCALCTNAAPPSLWPSQLRLPILTGWNVPLSAMIAIATTALLHLAA